MLVNKIFIGYPELDHPLEREKKELKIKYLDLMTYLANKYIDNGVIAKKKIESLAHVILHQDKYKITTDLNFKEMSIGVLKTRFSSFRFFSYRYLFLFDSLLLIAADNMKIAEQIKNEFNSWVNKRYHKKINNMVQLMYTENGEIPNDILITEEMIQTWRDIRTYISSNERRIFFTATMSAGKSTLINAIIGQEISDAKKAACTSNVLCFSSLPVKRHMYTLYDGETAIAEGLPNEIKDNMRKLKRNCEIYGYFNSNLTNRRIKLIDTPGINSSRNPEHKRITREALTGCEKDLLIYIIPVENYGGEDDYYHLVYILKHVKFKRIIFLVNMIDVCDFEDDSLDRILTDIKEHLRSIGYEKPEVFPISAKAGLRIKRIIYNEKMSDGEKNSADIFTKMFMKDEFNLSRFYGKEVSVSNITDNVQKAYENTGIPALERLLSMYN